MNERIFSLVFTIKQMKKLSNYSAKLIKFLKYYKSTSNTIFCSFYF
jgi:hypothetical protein